MATRPKCARIRGADEHEAGRVPPHADEVPYRLGDVQLRVRTQHKGEADKGVLGGFVVTISDVMIESLLGPQMP